MKHRNSNRNKLTHAGSEKFSSVAKMASCAKPSRACNINVCVMKGYELVKALRKRMKHANGALCCRSYSIRKNHYAVISFDAKKMKWCVPSYSVGGVVIIENRAPDAASCYSVNAGMACRHRLLRGSAMRMPAQHVASSSNSTA